MADDKMDRVKAPETHLPRGVGRDQRVSRGFRTGRRPISPRGGGRAWINGREVGGVDPRYRHLDCSYD
ncbi:MAG: hypothetical protein H0U20_06140 [Thermoleophilaceae bacterium]|nr:hypothetical protein [Thermoleophilaceae bacterium]